MHKSIYECISHRKDMVLEAVYISMPGPKEMKMYIDLLKQYVNIGQVYYVDEGQMALLAGIQQSQGLVVLSGTGSEHILGRWRQNNPYRWLGAVYLAMKVAVTILEKA